MLPIAGAFAVKGLFSHTQTKEQQQARLLKEIQQQKIQKKLKQKQKAQHIAAINEGGVFLFDRILKKSKYLKKWNLRCVSLTSHHIYTFIPVNQTKYKVNETESISINTVHNLVVGQNMQEEKYVFPFSFEGEDKHKKMRMFQFRCSTEEERQNWMKKIKKYAPLCHTK